MYLAVCLQLLVLVVVQAEGYRDASYEYNRTIFVSQNGTLNTSCWREVDHAWPCADVDLALQGAETFSGFVQIVIGPGHYNLTESFMFQDKNSFAILGSGGDATQVVIECYPLAGIAFNKSSRVLIENISFVGCGARHLSTSRNMTSSSSPLPFVHFQVALLFLCSESIVLSNISIHNSNGTGIAFLNVIGDVIITDSVIDNNVAPVNLPGGGGIHVEFSSCITAALSCKCDLWNSSISNSTFSITGCRFEGNQASTGKFGVADHLFHSGCENQFLFGRGGGVAVFFKDSARNNQLTLNNCSFHGNQAKIGAGLEVSIENGSQNNKVKIVSTSFVMNKCEKQVVPPSTFSTGGGAALLFLLSPELLTNRNSIIFDFCNFTKNEAYQGGGIALLSTGVASNHSLSIAEFNNCHFESNIGKVGSAVNIVKWLSFPGVNIYGYSVQPRFSDCRFCENNAIYQYLVEGDESVAVAGRTFATVYVEGTLTYFSRFVLFYRNNGSALVARGASIEFESNANVSFIENYGCTGGAMAILDNAWVVVCKGTQLTFNSNVASDKGGAIYAIQTDQHLTAYSDRCFIRYSDPYCSPQNWASQFVFSNNTAFNQPNSIYVSSLLPCAEPQNSASHTKYDLNRTFCSWNGWEFNNSTCVDEIRTSTVNLKTIGPSHNRTSIPGKSELLNIEALDELGHNVTNQTVFTVSIDHHNQSSQPVDTRVFYVSDGCFDVGGPPDSQASLSVEASDSRAVFLKLNVSVQPCPPGFVYNVTQKRCKCGGDFGGILHCKPEDFTSFIGLGSCISFNESDGFPVATHCPFSLSSQERIIQLNASHSFCDHLYRLGRLCSKCKAGYGVAVFSSNFKCVPCKESYKNWLKYFAIEFVPLTILFLIVFIFHISITSAATNAFIFFSQVVSLPLEVLIIATAWSLWLKEQDKANALTSIVMFPYGIWSLDFASMSGSDICLSHSFPVVKILALQYISAVYPLVLAITAFIIIELHARNFRPVVCLWRPLCLLIVRCRRTWQPKTSIMDAFATFILLTYTKFVRVSLSLLTPTRVLNDSGIQIDTVLRYDPSIRFFRAGHLPYAILAVFVLLTFGAIPPIILLLYPLKRFQRFLNRYRLLQSPTLHLFVDTFQGCYRDGTKGGLDCRCFAGLYFVFRLAIFTIYTSFTDYLLFFFICLGTTYLCMLVLFAIFQPYKQKFFNCLDVLVVALLLLINSFTFYAYVHLKSQNGQHFMRKIWGLTYALILLPLVYMVGYVVYRSLFGLTCCKKHCIKRSTPEGQPLTSSIDTHQIRREDSTASEFPDRVEHPDRYEDMSWSVPDAVIDDSLQASVDSDERTSLNVRMNGVADYGTNDKPTY